MLAEFIVDNRIHRFRVSLLSKQQQKKGEFLFDIELTDISENPTSKYEGVRIEYSKWREAVRSNRVKIII